MAALIDELHVLYSSGVCSQRSIADYLKISAPQLSDVFRHRHGLTGDQVFAAQQLLKDPKMQTPTLLDDDFDDGDCGDLNGPPKTLLEGKNRIEFLKEKDHSATARAHALQQNKIAATSGLSLPPVPPNNGPKIRMIGKSR